MNCKHRIIGMIVRRKTVFLIIRALILEFTKLIEFLFFEKVVLITFPKTAVQVFYFRDGSAEKLIHLI